MRIRAHPTDAALRSYFAPLLSSAERKRRLHEYAVSLEHNALAGIGPALAAARAPVRVVWGVDDTIFSAAGAEHLARAFGNSRGVRRLENAKLFWPEERPDVIAAQARILWESRRGLNAILRAHPDRGDRMRKVSGFVLLVMTFAASAALAAGSHSRRPCRSSSTRTSVPTSTMPTRWPR